MTGAEVLTWAMVAVVALGVAAWLIQGTAKWRRRRREAEADRERAREDRRPIELVAWRGADRVVIAQRTDLEDLKALAHFTERKRAGSFARRLEWKPMYLARKKHDREGWWGSPKPVKGAPNVRVLLAKGWAKSDAFYTISGLNLTDLPRRIRDEALGG